MALSATDRDLLAALQDGLPLTARPYADLAERLGLREADVLARLERLQADGTVKRFGVVVRHRQLGYRANAMTVWDVPDHRVRAAGHALAGLDYVTLSYRRPRRRPHWPYNLFAMIHGIDRDRVLALIDDATRMAGLDDCPRDVLFSTRCFKQRGARYGPGAQGREAAE